MDEKELLAKLRRKKGVYRGWKQGQVTWGKHRDTDQASRNEVRKVKAHLELSLVRDFKGIKKGFYKYIGNKRKTRENVSPLLNGARDLVTKDMEKAEVLNAFLTSVVISKINLQESQAPEIRGKC